MTVGDSDISLFPSPCFRFLSPTFALFASFCFLFPGFRFLRLLRSRAPLPFAFSFPASRFPSPYLRHLLPAFSVFAPIFSASTPIFVASFRLFIARKTHSANPADAHELNSPILPHFLHDPHGRKRRCDLEHPYNLRIFALTQPKGKYFFTPSGAKCFANMRFSIIVPVYNRPNECDELLDSLTRQSFTDFEVIIVEDGSSVPCETVVARYADRLRVHYYSKPNSGPGQTRNYGAERAQGDYLLILDSDVLLPERYLAAVDAELNASPCDAFGGPDRAHSSFTPMQKAINYAMTSFFTTGGIRGQKKGMDKFYPRSFNMGVRRDVYQALGGFSNMRFGEDIDFSTRIFKGGYRCRLFPDAWVYHKRRTDLRKFFKQVHNSGIARIHLSRRHPGTHKLVHLLPAVFTLGVLFLLLCAVLLGIFGQGCLALAALSPLLLFALLIGIDATRREHSLGVGCRAIAAAFVQLLGYGSGYLHAWWQCRVLHSGEFEAFSESFYQ